MKTLPTAYTNEYFDFMETVIELLQKHMPLIVYGFTNYNLAFHWTDNNVYTPQQINVRTAILILDKMQVAGKLTEYIYNF